MIRSICAAAALSLAFAAPAVGDESADKAAIEAAVLDYFHGQGEASLERLFRAFAAEQASMVGVVDGEEGDEVRAYKDMVEVLNNWASNEDPPGGDRDGEILDMSLVDGRIATVMFRSTDRFYDALTLAKVDGDWKIVAKAFVLQ
ncbi:MAG: nuclear transport factor 2 family protein [Pseudomonadota bacterium]